jgi:hypothetical protein
MLAVSTGGRPPWLRWAGGLTRWQGRVPLFVGVAGHRQLEVRERGDIERRLRHFFMDLRARLPATPVIVVSRLAAGADQLAASVALAAGCESACLLPQDVATYRAAMREEGCRATFDRLLASSVVLGPAGGGAVAADPELAYAQAGYYLMRHATLLLALWDGVESRRPGSVGELIRARTLARMEEVDPTLCIMTVGRSDLRMASPPAPCAIDAIAGCGWQEAEAFNAAVSAAGGAQLAETPAPFAAIPDERLADVAAVLRAASLRAAAIRAELTHRRLLLQAIAFLAAIAFAAFIKFGDRSWILWVYLALLAGALAVRVAMRQQRLHRRYIDYRCLAEGLRVAIYWHIAGVVGDARGSPASRLADVPNAALGWVGLGIAALDGWMGLTAPPADFDGCDFAARHWLGVGADQDLHAQIPYYRAAASRLRRIARRVERVVSFTLITGIASAALLAVLPAGWLGSLAPVLITIMGLMPLVAGTASGAIDVPAEMEVARQYEHTGRLLTQAARRLAAAETQEERRQILFEAGAAVLAEQRVWHAVVRQRSPERRARG